MKNGIIDNDTKLEEYVSIVMNPAYVHINEKTDKEIRKLQKEWKNKGVYTIGRYGAWTYCSMEDCMIQAKELAKTLK